MAARFDRFSGLLLSNAVHWFIPLSCSAESPSFWTKQALNGSFKDDFGHGHFCVMKAPPSRRCLRRRTWCLRRRRELEVACGVESNGQGRNRRPRCRTAGYGGKRGASELVGATLAGPTGTEGNGTRMSHNPRCARPPQHHCNSSRNGNLRHARLPRV